MTAGRPRIGVVVRGNLNHPTGFTIRVAQTVRALAEAGDVELITLELDPEDPAASAVADVVESHVQVRLQSRPVPKGDLVRWVAVGRLPRRVLAADLGADRAALASAVTGSYDVLWCVTARAGLVASEVHADVRVLDLIDFEGDRDVELSRTTARVRGRGRRAFGHWAARLDRHRLRQLIRDHVQGGWRVAVSSFVDRDRSAVPQLDVLENCYPQPARPVGRTSVGDPATILLAGFFGYAPNADGARWFCTEVFPRVGAKRPGTTLRLVGRGLDGLVPPMAQVEQVGPVADMEAELARADLVVAPLRIASGTRIKILEAFAHRVPVATTVPGAMGLPVEPGVHLAVADDAEGFARRCVELLADAPLRAGMIDAAAALYEARYTEESFARSVRALARLSGS